MAPQQVEKYKLLEEVGHGGMAVVYRGLDTHLNREVAVKILHSHLAEEEESKQRFHREANAVAKLRHENIIEIFDYSGMDSEESYIVTEFIHGKTLREFLNKHPVSHPEIAVMIIVEVCHALGHAHDFGVIHRDIKPENIMIREDGLVKLTDFGIAQVVDVQRLTVTGQLLGSPAYMAPELVEGKPVDTRADVFSVGTLLYQMSTGELPFKGNNAHEVLKRISDGKYVDPEVANPTVGSQLARIIRKTLAHDPDARYLTIGELRESLEEFLADVEISDVKMELAEYFSSPKDYSKGLQGRVVEALTRRGVQARGEKKIPQALEYFNRVLCVDPANPKVLGILDQISRRRKIGRAIGVILMLGALAAGLYFLARYWPEGTLFAFTNDAGSGAVDAVVPPPPDIPPKPPDKKKPDSKVAPGVDGKLQMFKKPIRILNIPPKRVRIIPVPQQVSIWLNGRRLGTYGPDLRHISLPSGRKSKLVVRNDACCYEYKQTLDPRRVKGEIHVKLPWKPARMVVQVTPKVEAVGLLMHHRGTTSFRAGQTMAVPIPTHSENGRSEVKLKVSAEGYSTVTRKVRVRYNENKVVRITLKKVGN